MKNVFSRLAPLSLLLAAALGAGSVAQAADDSYTVRLPVLSSAYPSANQTINFGNVMVGTLASRTLVFTNAGTADTTIQSINTSGHAVTITNNKCTVGTVVAKGQNCTMDVSLKPMQVGTWNASVAIGHSATTTADLANLLSYGVTLASTLTFDKSLLSFGMVPIQSASQTQTLKLTNSGSEAVTVATVSLAETTQYFQIEGGDCETTLAPGASCTVSATFNPKLLGTANSSLMLTMEDGTRLYGATLVGTGVQGVPTFDATTLTFQQVPVGAPTVQTLTLTNTGTGMFGINGLTVTGDAAYSLESTTCGSSLAPAASCQVRVQFLPPNTDTRSAVLTLEAANTFTRINRVQLFGQPVSSLAALSVSPTPLAFPATPVGQSANLTLTLSSTGTLPVSVTGYQVGGTNPADFKVSNASNCTGTLNPGMQCQLQVTASPTATGARSAQLILQTSLTTPAAPVGMTVTGQAGKLVASPTVLSFPTTEIGKSAVLTTVLTNQGDAALTLNSITPDSNLGSAFTTQGCTGQAIAAGGNCTLTVTFAPTTVGTLNGTLALANTGVPSSVSLTVGAQGVAAAVPQATLDPFVCTPATVQTGATATCTAALRNTGSTSLTYSGVTRTSTDFAAPTTNCPATLAAGANCTVTLTASSAVANKLTTTVTVATSAGSKSGTATVTVAAPTASLTPTDHGLVYVGASNVRSHVLTNTGLFPVTVTIPAKVNPTGAISVGGSASGGTACANNQMLSSGQACVVTTTCTPTAVGSLTTALSVTTTAGAATANVNCQGEAPPATGAALTFTPNPVDLGVAQVGKAAGAFRVVTVKNNALGSVTIASMSVSGKNAADFTLATNGCVKALAAGTTCQFTVNGNAGAAGARQAQLDVSANTATPVSAVPLLMTGVQGALALSPAAYDYGSVTVGVTKTATFTVTNTGTAPSLISGVGLTGTDAARFSIVTNGCATATVAPGATCSVVVAYAPTAATSSTATLQVSSSNSSPAAVSASLTGSAVPAPIPGGTLSESADCTATVQYGQTPTCTVTLTSNGAANLVVTGYTLTRTAGDFASTRPVTTATKAMDFTGLAGGALYNATTGQLTMPPGSSARLAVALTPQSATTPSALAYTSQSGTHVNQLALNVLSGAVTGQNTLTFNVAAPVIQTSLSPAALSFVGTGSGKVTATVTNRGIGAVKFATGTTGTGAPGSVSTVSGPTNWLSMGTTGSCTATTSLAPGSSCTVDVVCAAMTPNVSVKGRVKLNTAVPFGTGNALLPATQDFDCSAVSATATITPAYPGLTNAVATGSQSGNWLRFTNTSTVGQYIQEVGDSAGFVIYTDSTNPKHCKKSLLVAPGDYCDFLETVTSTNSTAAPVPVASKGYVKTDRNSYPFGLNYTVYGISVTPVSAVPTTLQKGDSRDVTFNITNATPSAVSEVTYGVLGMTVKTNNCQSIAAGASCQVVYTIAPPTTNYATSYNVTLAASGKFERILNNSKSAAVAVSTNAGYWLGSLTLTSPSAQLVAGSHPTTMSGYTSLATHVLRNTGAGPLAVTSVTSDLAVLTVAQNDCPATLSAGQTCNITTQFAPTSPTGSAVKAVLSVNTSAGVRTANLDLKSTPQVSVTPDCPSIVPLGSAGNCKFVLRNDSDAPANTAIKTYYNQQLCSYGPYYSCSPSSRNVSQYDWGVMGNPGCATGVSPGSISGFGRLTHNCPFNLAPGQTCEVTMPYQSNVFPMCLYNMGFWPVPLSGAISAGTNYSGWLSIGSPSVYFHWNLDSIKATPFKMENREMSFPKQPFGSTAYLDVPIKTTMPITVDNVSVLVGRLYEGVRTGAPATTAKATDIITLDSTTCSGSMTNNSTCNVRLKCSAMVPGGYKVRITLKGEVPGGTVDTSIGSINATGVTAYCEADYPPATAADITTAPSMSAGNVKVGGSNNVYASVKNASGWPVQVTNATITGPNASMFSLYASCTSVPSFSSCYFTTRYNPTSAGSHSATLNVYTGLSSTPVSIQLNGSAY